MTLEPVYHRQAKLIDLDGTLIKKQPPEKYFSDEAALEDAIEIVNTWFRNGVYIVIWTARPNAYREQTRKQLDRLGVLYHELLMDKPYSHKIEIYDDNPITAHKIIRNEGLGKYIKDNPSSICKDDGS